MTNWNGLPKPRTPSEAGLTAKAETPKAETPKPQEPKAAPDSSAGIKDALGELEAAGRKHRVEAEVTSAVPLTDSERQQLETRLKARHGEDLPISYRVEPAILGGLKVRVGDRLIDGSVASRLGQLRQQMTGQ